MSPTALKRQMWNGPSINGVSTKVHLVNRDELAATQYPQGMMEVINAAFSHGHPPYIPAEFVRILSPKQMLGELRSGGFSLIVTREAQGAEVVIATGSAVPGDTHSSSEAAIEPGEKTSVDRSLEARRRIPGVVDWELKHLCVEPGSMRQGLASYILGLLDEEVSARTASMQNETTPRIQQRKPRIRLMITTVAEMNGRMYQKRGYKTVEFSSYPKGTLGGTEAFQVWHMDRIME